MTATTTERATTMRAIVREKFGRPDVLELQDVEKPQLADDGVLVRVRASSVNRADWYDVTGTPWIARPMMGLRSPKSRFAGSDFAGTVEAVGKDVTELRPGCPARNARVRAGEAGRGEAVRARRSRRRSPVHGRRTRAREARHLRLRKYERVDRRATPFGPNVARVRFPPPPYIRSARCPRGIRADAEIRSSEWAPRSRGGGCCSCWPR